MALRNKIFIACESLLRVPPLLVIDEIFRQNFGGRANWLMGEAEAGILRNYEPIIRVKSDKPQALSFMTYLFSNMCQGLGSIMDLVGLHCEGPDAANSIAGEDFKVLKVMALLQLCVVALFCFFLPAKNLVKLYSYILAFTSLYLSYWLRPMVLDHMTWRSLPLLFPNFAIRTGLAGIHFVTRTWPSGYPHNSQSLFWSLIFGLMNPAIFSLFFVTAVLRIPAFVFLSLVIILQGSLWTGVSTLYRVMWGTQEDKKGIPNDYESILIHLTLCEPGRLRINLVFRLFWLSRAIHDLVYGLTSESFADALRLLMTNGTETCLGVIGLTLIISGIANQVGVFLIWILYRGTNSDYDMNRFGSITALSFFILCLQTSLTSLHPAKRLERLLKNLVLLATAHLHAFHFMVAPLLHEFRAFKTLQFRAVALSLVFLSGSVWSLIVFLRTIDISTWSMAVIAMALEFKIKITMSLLTSFFLYMAQRIDTPQLLAHARQALHAVLPDSFLNLFAHISDQFDSGDIVFYLQGFSYIAEFMTGIFLFGNAVWIFLFESGSTIRAIGITIHVYFNIWCNGKLGWKVYTQRRTASRKIESLTDATAEQLGEKKDDVCAICYEGMDSAKVTLCGHFFHAVCLRKWLYVQNTCPLCHQVLYSEQEPGSGGGAAEENDVIQVGPGVVNVAEINENARAEIISPPMEWSLHTVESPRELDTDSESNFSGTSNYSYQNPRSSTFSSDHHDYANFRGWGPAQQNSSRIPTSFSINQASTEGSYQASREFRPRREMMGQNSNASLNQVRSRSNRNGRMAQAQNTVEITTSDSEFDL